VIDQGKETYQWVRKATEYPSIFDPKRERETSKKVRKELLGLEWITSNSTPVYYMPLTYNPSVVEKSIEKVSTLKHFLKCFLELMKDETTLKSLRGMIDQCVQDREMHVI
jgi:hypothetical protein